MNKKQKRIKRKIAKSKKILRYYDAAQSSNYHKVIRGGGNSGDSVTHGAVKNLRSWSRYLDENHDLTIGIHDNLVNRIVGAGLTVEPIVKRKNGNLWAQINDQLRDLWLEFWRRPEVTGEVPGNEVERLLVRSWLRDGEVLTNHVMGTGPAIQHNSRVPYSLELLEADYLPMDFNGDRIVHGVEKNTWGRPLAYHLYKEHPGNTIVPFNTTTFDTKRVSADFITHLKFVRRLRQTRGVPIIHGIINRMDDIKDYSESERIKARVNAAFTSFIKRTADYQGDGDENGNIPFEMQSGMIFDGLKVGEELGSVGTDTPNPNLGPFISEMMRAAASGTGTSYSSISKHYDGNYSSQRQELVEAREGYKKLLNFFIDGLVTIVKLKGYRNGKRHFYSFPFMLSWFHLRQFCQNSFSFFFQKLMRPLHFDIHDVPFFVYSEDSTYSSLNTLFLSRFGIMKILLDMSLYLFLKTGFFINRIFTSWKNGHFIHLAKWNFLGSC